jgi:cobyrinic acid a,c-diamide synthase
MNMPRLLIAAPMSGSGKTTITAGLLAAFAARGLHVAAFKVGPDYIDPTYHALATGRPSYNLDTWLLPPDRVLNLFLHRAKNADLALIEGMMGLFDGYSGADDTGSAAHVARTISTPVILVLNVEAMGGSAAAVVQGFRDFDLRVQLAGVILNKVGGEAHARLIQTAIGRSVPVLGYLAADERLRLPERHLGLIPALEVERWQSWLATVREKIAATLDLDRLLEVAHSASALAQPKDDLFTLSAPRATIAVARDAAFSFLYDDTLDLLRAAGAKLALFSPLEDATLPEGTQAIYLCGGFPERYAAALAANTPMQAAIRAAFTAQLPIYAECGGLMYLTEGIVDEHDNTYPMVGLLKGKSIVTPHLNIGYREVSTRHDSWLWRAGEILRGHEFHYSTWQAGSEASAYALEGERFEGAQIGSLIASYLHLHFLACPDLAYRFVEAASKSKTKVPLPECRPNLKS